MRFSEAIDRYGYCQCGCGGRTNPAAQTDRRRGWVKDQPMPFLRGHGGKWRGPQYIVDPETGCWVWQWRKTPKGYGQWRGRLAHRKVYEDKLGPVADGLELDHLCRNRLCVNPAHLEPVTHATNVQRGAKPKLTAEQVTEIRESDESHAELGRRFGVHASTIAKRRAA